MSPIVAQGGLQIDAVSKCGLLYVCGHEQRRWHIVAARGRILTHWGRDKMAAFSQTTLSNAFFNVNIRISLKFVPKGLINNIPALVLIMAWRRPGAKPLSEPMLVRSLTHICVTRPQWVNPLRPKQDGRHFPDDIFKYILLNEYVWISLKISLKFVNNIPGLVHILAWRRPGDKPLSLPRIVDSPTHWVSMN